MCSFFRDRRRLNLHVDSDGHPIGVLKRLRDPIVLEPIFHEIKLGQQ
jgi:hypothetical protein